MVDPELVPADLITAARVCRETLVPALDRDWSVPAGDLEWDCRSTLDHIVDTLFLYAAYVASRGSERLSPPRNGDPSASPAQLLATVGTAAAVLTEVARAAPPGTRAFHPAGMADVSGWIGMGCEEILLHTDDIARGLDLPYRPPDDLSSRILARLFPWAPSDIDPWDGLRWATGRAALPDSRAAWTRLVLALSAAFRMGRDDHEAHVTAGMAVAIPGEPRSCRTVRRSTMQSLTSSDGREPRPSAQRRHKC